MIEENIQEIIDKIDIARKWAEEHFNFANRNDTRLVGEDLELLTPSFFIEYPTPDTMRVTPSIMGKPANIWTTYRLAFRKDGSMVWKGKHPIYDTALGKLEIDNVERTVR